MSNFFFCHYVFKKPSAAEASESVYMRERVNRSPNIFRCLSFIRRDNVKIFSRLELKIYKIKVAQNQNENLSVAFV